MMDIDDSVDDEVIHEGDDEEIDSELYGKESEEYEKLI